MTILIALLALAGPQDKALEKAAALFDAEWKDAEGPAKDKLRTKLLALQARGPAAKTLGNYPAAWGGGGGPKNRCGLDFEHARSGRASLKMLAPDPALGGFQAWTCSDEIPAKAGEVFKFSAWILTTGEEAFAGRLQVKFRGAKNGAESQLLIVPIRVDGDRPVWTRVEGEAVAPAETVTAEIAFTRSAAKGGVAWIDDVSFTVGKRELLKNGGFEVR